MLSGLIQDFERLSAELCSVVRHGDESEVAAVDARLQVLTRKLFKLQVYNRSEIMIQIRFFGKLAQLNCEDGYSVRRYTDMMTSLFKRYLDSSVAQRPVNSGFSQIAMLDGYDPSVPELALDSLSERVAVFGLDYRYLYCNKANADFHQKQPSDFIGKYLFDMIDMERFQSRARPRLDQCFGGAQLSYNYEAVDADGRVFDVNCRMIPLPGAEKTVIGAVLVLTMDPVFARHD